MWCGEVGWKLTDWLTEQAQNEQRGTHTHSHTHKWNKYIVKEKMDK